MENDKFTLGKCSLCGEHKALKNGVCAKCALKGELPDFFKDLFEDKNEN